MWAKAEAWHKRAILHRVSQIAPWRGPGRRQSQAPKKKGHRENPNGLFTSSADVLIGHRVAIEHDYQQQKRRVSIQGVKEDIHSRNFRHLRTHPRMNAEEGDHDK